MEEDKNKSKILNPEVLAPDVLNPDVEAEDGEVIGAQIYEKLAEDEGEAKAEEKPLAPFSEVDLEKPTETPEVKTEKPVETKPTEARPVDKTMENLKKCICSKCPSYTLGCKIKEMPKNLLEIAMHHSDLSKVEHLEGMFCAFGKSKCLAEEKGCNCTKCEVYKEYNLSKIYFCIRDI